MKKITGVGAAYGIGIGEIVIKEEEALDIEKREADDAVEEIKKLNTAIEEYDRKLTDLIEEAKKDAFSEGEKILDVYRVILKDDVFFSAVIKRVNIENVNIDYALDEEKKKTVKIMSNLKDEYMRERASDIENVMNELIRIIHGRKSSFDLSGKTDIIIAAKDLTPEDTVKFSKGSVKGFITEKGGLTSHTVILAKTLGIPAVIGVENVLESFKDGEKAILDGKKGEIYISPDEETLKKYDEIKLSIEKRESLFNLSIEEEARTLDGFKISVEQNSGDKESLSSFDSKICDGVGLFRTEFLYMDHTDYPSEEAQFKVYKNIAELACGKEIIIRTLDIGGDKQLEYMDLPMEDNPFLGYRAIRICLDREEMFLTQLKAILRASHYGNIKIMFPMIVNLEELLLAKAMVKKAMEALDKEGVSYNPQIKTGIMIETPGAVLLSDILAKESDFFSIGSNDLIQYVTASDRMNERVRYLYDSCNISVLRAIAITVKNAKKAGIPVGICGEAASEERLLPLWIGLGIDKLSMSAKFIGKIKYYIRKANKAELEKETEKILNACSIEEVKERLNTLLQGIS